MEILQNRVARGIKIIAVLSMDEAPAWRCHKPFKEVPSHLIWRKRMRDKILCSKWTDPKATNAKKTSPYGSSFGVLTKVTLSIAVLVSIQRGERMSIEAFLGFFDSLARIKKTRFLEISREELGTLCVTESLFRGTIVDFDFCSHSGGGNYANVAGN